MAIHLGAAYVDIVPSTKGLGRELSGKVVPEVSKAGDAAGRGFGSRFASAVGSLVSGAATVAGAAAGTIFASSLTKGFGRLKAIDAAQFKLKGLGHDAEAVEAIMGSALKAVEGTAFGLGDAATIAASAVAAGIEPGKELTRYLSLIGDTATIAGGSLEEIGGIIGGITTTNQVYRRDLLQLANRGLPVFTWLQEAYEVTADELNTMVSRGEVDAETFLQVIEDNIGGAALTAGDSWSGMVANIGAAMGRFGATVLEPLMAGFKEVAPGLMGVFDELGGRIEPFMASFAESEGFRNFIDSLAGAADQIGPLIDSLAGLSPILAPLAGFVGASGLGGLVGLVPGLSGLAGAINPIVGAIAGFVLASEPLREILWDIIRILGDSFRDVFERVAPILAEVADVLAGVLAEALEAIAPVLPVLVETFGEIAGTIGEALVQILPPIGEALVTILEAIAPLLTPEILTGLLGLVNPWFLLLLALEPLTPVLVDLAEMFGDLITEIVDRLSPFLPDIVDAFGEIAQVLGEGLGEVIEALLPILPELTESWIKMMEALLPLLPPLLRLAAVWTEKISVPLLILAAEAFTALAVAFTELVTPILNVFGSGLDIVVGWLERLSDFADGFPGLPDIGGWFRDFPSLDEVAGVITGFVEGIPQALGDFAESIGGWFTSGFEDLPESLTGVLGGLTEWFTGLPLQLLGALHAAGAWLWDEWLGPAIGALPGLLDGGIEGTRQWFGALPGNIVSWVGDVGTTLWQKGSDLLEGLRSGVSDKWQDVQTWFSNLPSRIIGALGSLGSTLWQAGSDLLKGLWEGAKSVIPDFKGWLEDLTSWIPSWKGPPDTDRVLLEPVGELIMDGLIRGFENRIGVVRSTLGGLTDDLAATSVSVRHYGAVPAAFSPVMAPPRPEVVVGGHLVTERDLVMVVVDGANRMQSRSVAPLMPGVSG